MEKKALNDAELEQVNGGVQVGTTSYGYPVDENGNVTFTDKTGASVVLTSAQWKKLLQNYTHAPGNPEAYLSTVPISELRKANLIPNNPFGE